MRNRLLILLAALLSATCMLVACGGGNSTTNNSGGNAATNSGGPVPPSGQVVNFSINSVNTGITYLVNVYLPPAYGQNSIALPAIYAADAQYQLQDIIQTLGQYNINAIVVAVNYIDETEREDDFLPLGAKSFYNFVTQELIPRVETTYPVDPKRRTLLGYSYSGVFSVLAIFYDSAGTRFFSSIVSTDGSFFADPDDEIELEQQTFATNPLLPVNLFMTCAANCSSVQPYFDRISGQGFAGLNPQFTAYNNLDHATVLAPSIDASLHAIFGSN
jgi:hypothetical protein